MTAMDYKIATSELDGLIDKMRESVTELGSDAHRKLVLAVCDCIEPLVTKRFKHRNAECIALVRRWAAGGEFAKPLYYSDCHNSVLRLMKLISDIDLTRCALHTALVDGPDGDYETHTEISRMCAVIRSHYPEFAESVKIDADYLEKMLNTLDQFEMAIESYKAPNLEEDERVWLLNRELIDLKHHLEQLFNLVCEREAAAERRDVAQRVEAQLEPIDMAAFAKRVVQGPVLNGRAG